MKREGTIYKLVSGNKVYIGSTIQSLNRRLTEHRSEYKRYVAGKRPYCASFDVIGDKKCKVFVLEKAYVKDEPELHQLEQKWISKLELSELQNRIKAGKQD